MIQKVNSPAHLFLVGSAKSAENDPGGSSGSGLAYERPQDQHPQHSSDSDHETPPSSPPTSELDKAGMTSVVIDLLENKDHQPPSPAPGLSTKYLVDQSKTKGLLLNKKAE